MRVVSEGRLKGAFTGWSGGTRFTFQGGETWKQVAYAYHYHYAYMPHARVVEDGGRFWLEVERVAERLEVEHSTPLQVVADGQLKGAFKGWTGKTEFEFVNGQRWRQRHYAYMYHYAYMPNARVVCDGGYWLEVDGVSAPLQVERVR